MAVENRVVARVRAQLASGDLVLFTGAGFSMSAQSRSGQRVASVNDLRSELWRLAFPATPVVDPESPLGDLFEVAVQRARNAVRDVMERRLRVDSAALPDRYGRWFSLPWFRHYTLNVDDLDEAVATHFDLPRDLRALSGQRDGVPQTASLLSVHLNGRLSDFPDVTFSPPQYGQRLARAGGEAWYPLLVADLLHHPVLFVGTVLEEPNLWQHIELRQHRERQSVELRPSSYLVTPQVPAVRAALLKRYNVEWVEATEEEFFSTVFDGAAGEAEQGHGVLARRYHPSQGRVELRGLSELRQQDPPDDLSMFLLGREPTWADVTDGFAVERRFEQNLLNEALSGGIDVVLLTGTAATGKSTTTMRIALGLDAAGRSVGVLDTLEGDRRVPRIVAAAAAMRADVVVLDDVDTFGERAGRLIRELVAGGKSRLVVAALRSSRLQGLDLLSDLGGLRVREETVPLLHDNDIDVLIDALSRANRLGRLAGLSKEKRRHIFREQSNRQLLVAMYKATSGDSFQNRVYSECEDLAGVARLAYGMAAIATAERFWVSRDELTLGVGAMTGGMDNEKLNVVKELIDRQLLLVDGNAVRVRHRWIAETAIDCYQGMGVIAASLKGLAVALATKADPQSPTRVRERRLLNRILNHDYLPRLVNDIAVAREVYALVEDHLSWDYHYWLQRGSLEVETGDLGMAEHFLNTAVALAPHHDYRVETEYAYMLLKKASKSPRAREAVGWADAALKDLEHAMADRGTDDSYPFHVYGSQGLSWARRAPLLPAERATLGRVPWCGVTLALDRDRVRVGHGR